MVRKTVTVIELIIIGYFLIMGVYVYANRKDPNPSVEYPYGVRHLSLKASQSPMVLDTPRRYKVRKPGEFSATTQWLIDSLIIAKDKSASGQFSARGKHLLDSAMREDAKAYYQLHPPNNPHGMQWHVESIVLDSTQFHKNRKAKTHGKRH